MLTHMKSISISVIEADYAAFQRASREQGRPAAELIREAMARYRETVLDRREPLLDLPVLVGHRLVGALPARSELNDEIAGERGFAL